MINEPEPDVSEVLTTRDMEKVLKINRQTQVDLRATGQFVPHFFAGHRVLYRKEALLRWIAEQEAKAAAGVAEAQTAPPAGGGGTAPEGLTKAPLTLGDSTLAAALDQIIRTTPMGDETRQRIVELLGADESREHLWNGGDNDAA